MRLGLQRRKVNTSKVWRRRGKRKGLLVFLLLLVLSFGLVIFIYSKSLGGAEMLVSPLAANNQNIKNTLEKLLSESEIEFVNVVFRSPSSYMVKLQEDGEAILSLHKDFRKQITSLQALLKQLTIEGKRLIRIDFTFDKPVIEIQ